MHLSLKLNKYVMFPTQQQPIVLYMFDNTFSVNKNIFLGYVKMDVHIVSNNKRYQQLFDFQCVLNQKL